MVEAVGVEVEVLGARPRGKSGTVLPGCGVEGSESESSSHPTSSRGASAAPVTET